MYGDKELVALFTSHTTEYSRVTYIRRKLRLYVYFMRIELVVELVLKVKSAVDFLSPHIYD